MARFAAAAAARESGSGSGEGEGSADVMLERAVEGEVSSQLTQQTHTQETHPQEEVSLDGVAFPFLTLLVSGGHCQLLLSRAVGEHEVTQP